MSFFRKTFPKAGSALLMIAALYAGFVMTLYMSQRNFIYFPDTTAPDIALASQTGFAAVEAVVTPAEHLPLRGWYFSSQPENGKTILFFHGNAGNISHRLYKIAPYLAQGYGVLLAEYRGYGGNPGTPSEAGLYEDGTAYYDWLARSGIAPEDIILYGESLGTGVAVEMAKDKNARALILETPYSSLLDIAQKTYFFIPFIGNLMHDKFHSDQKIAGLSIPKLFLIAGRDEVIGSQTGLKLYETAKEPRTLKVFDEAGHNTLYDFNAPETVLEFLKSLP